MKLNLFVLFLLIISKGCSSAAENMVRQGKLESNAEYVNPFIGTATDHGQTDPAATVPFGMVKLGPDTWPAGHSGYDYNAELITGFSHTRVSGMGCNGVGGNIRVLPLIKPSEDSIPKGVKYFKDTERATPGYYSVKLENNVLCEMTSTRQVGFHKYTFPESEKAQISINLLSSFSRLVSSESEINQNGYIIGRIMARGGCNKGSHKFYFALKTEGLESYPEKTFYGYKYEINTTKDEEIIIRTALSTVSTENAILNLEITDDMMFSDAKSLAQQQWKEYLGVIDVETANDTLKQLFYTHLYHSLQSPFIVQDNNGEYRGTDDVIRTTISDHYYGWSLWDTYRTKIPLISFLYTDHFKDVVSSLVRIYKQGKPDRKTTIEPFISVRMEHSLIVLLDAYRKNLFTSNIEDIYESLKTESDKLPYNSPDKILESSYEYWALSEIAYELSKEADHNYYKNKALEYKDIWKDKFLHMGDNADIMHAEGLYEGTLWQYRWFVPFDIGGIQELMGGKKHFEEQLDYFFDNSLFNMGNQPDIQVPFLYAYTDSPWKTQKLVYDILTKPMMNWYGTHNKWDEPVYRKVFQASPEGFIPEMDDDAGTMSAWFVWAAMGLYPICPGNPDLIITTPLFESIKIQLGDSHLEIVARGLSDDAIYIQSILFNGEQYNSYFIDSNLLSKGGKLELIMGKYPPQ